jgi:hypothetical protein
MEPHVAKGCLKTFLENSMQPLTSIWRYAEAAYLRPHVVIVMFEDTPYPKLLCHSVSHTGRNGTEQTSISSRSAHSRRQETTLPQTNTKRHRS